MRIKYCKRKGFLNIYSNKIYKKLIKIMIKEYLDGIRKIQNLNLLLISNHYKKSFKESVVQFKKDHADFFIT